MAAADLRRYFLQEFRHFPLQVRLQKTRKIVSDRIKKAVSTLEERMEKLAEEKLSQLLRALPDGPDRRARAKRLFDARDERMAELKEYALQQLLTIPDLQRIGSGTAPHVLSVSLVGWPSQNIVTDLSGKGICISAGSACHQGKASHVVAALKLAKRTSGGVIRISFGPETTKEDIDACVSALRAHHDNRMPML